MSVIVRPLITAFIALALTGCGGKLAWHDATGAGRGQAEFGLDAVRCREVASRAGEGSGGYCPGCAGVVVATAALATLNAFDRCMARQGWVEVSVE